MKTFEQLVPARLFSNRSRTRALAIALLQLAKNAGFAAAAARTNRMQLQTVDDSGQKIAMRCMQRRDATLCAGSSFATDTPPNKYAPIAVSSTLPRVPRVFPSPGPPVCIAYWISSCPSPCSIACALRLSVVSTVWMLCFHVRRRAARAEYAAEALGPE